MAKKGDRKPPSLTVDPSLKDFGGDPEKKALSEAVDNGHTTTRVFVDLDSQAKEAWNNEKHGHIALAAILISAAELVDEGVLVPKGTKEDKPLVRVNLKTFEELVVPKVIKYRATRPMSKENARDALRQAEGSLLWLKDKNPSASFAEADEALATARKVFAENALGPNATRLNYRPVVSGAETAVETAYDKAVEQIAGRVRRMAASAGVDVEASVEQALTAATGRERLSRLNEIRKDLFAMGGRDPQMATREDAGQGIGNRPDRRGGGGEPRPQRKRFERRSQRF